MHLWPHITAHTRALPNCAQLHVCSHLCRLLSLAQAHGKELRHLPRLPHLHKCLLPLAEADPPLVWWDHAPPHTQPGIALPWLLCPAAGSSSRLQAPALQHVLCASSGSHLQAPHISMASACFAFLLRGLACFISTSSGASATAAFTASSRSSMRCLCAI